MPARPDNPCLSYLKALSEDSRWNIVRVLVAAPESLTLGELAARLGISDYNASRHVRILSEAGILTVEREGRHKRIGITPGFRSHLQSEPGETILDLGCCRFDFTPAPPEAEKEPAL